MSHLIAIDGGGTGCRALVADTGGNVLGRGEAGAANIVTDPDGSLASVIQAAGRAAAAARLPSDVLGRCDAVLGLAGANIGSHAEAMRARLPFARSRVVSDVAIAMHGALGDHDGAIAILGTGSVFAARKGEQVRIVGGWGFKVGDQASGARLGRSLLEEVLFVHDGIHPGSDFTAQVLGSFGGDAWRIVEFAQNARPGDFATFAPQIFEAADRGDRVALSIIGDAVAGIEETLEAIMPPGCDRLCLLGGLARLYQERLDADWRALVRAPLGDAVDGALALALHHFAPAGDNADA